MVSTRGQAQALTQSSPTPLVNSALAAATASPGVLAQPGVPQNPVGSQPNSRGGTNPRGGRARGPGRGRGTPRAVASTSASATANVVEASSSTAPDAARATQQFGLLHPASSPSVSFEVPVASSSAAGGSTSEPAGQTTTRQQAPRGATLDTSNPGEVPRIVSEQSDTELETINNAVAEVTVTPVNDARGRDTTLGAEDRAHDEDSLGVSAAVPTPSRTESHDVSGERTFASRLHELRGKRSDNPHSSNAQFLAEAERRSAP